MNVYDFDNTIYRGESSLDLFFFYLKKHPSLVKYLPKAVIGIIKYKLRMVSIDSLLNNYAIFAEDFLRGIKTLDRDMEDFWDKHMHKVKPFYRAQQCEDDLIVSASPEFFLEVLFKRIGIKNLIGTTVDKEKGKIKFVCYRENKIPAFKSRYPDTIIENFYTDSMNDKPLMDLSKNVFLVKGSRIRQIKP
jgi:phosphatidylglycerophosphatase C